MGKQKKPVYETTWRNKFLTLEAENIEEMASTLEKAAASLRKMAQAGITLDPDGGTADDYARLVTMDPKVAEAYGLEAFPGADDEEEE